MSRRGWIIEHRAWGAYLGEAPNAAGAIVPRFRADDQRNRAMVFGHINAVNRELARILGSKSRRIDPDALEIISA